MPNADQHTKALKSGAWQCPQCALGWQYYSITQDKNECTSCGYKGGPITNSFPDVVFHVEMKIAKALWLACRIDKPVDISDDTAVAKWIHAEQGNRENIDKLISTLIKPALHVLAGRDFSKELAGSDTATLYLALCRTPPPNTTS